MKILYAIQATGNGHISRAMELLPHIEKYGQVDIFLSGANSTLVLDAPVKFRSRGLSLFYKCDGGLHYWKMLKEYAPLKLRKEINELPVEKYDLVINDFEFITAAACAKKKIPSVCFGHQASFISEKTPRPVNKNHIGEWILKNYARATHYTGLHFEKYDDFIFTPVIKKEIREAEPCDKNYITVYLPAYCEPELKQIFGPLNNFRFEIFSWQTKQIHTEGNIRFLPVSKKLFNESFIHCTGIITGGGFETPAEALHLGKKLMAIPIRGQYEQLCNAEALRRIGITCIKKPGKDFAAEFNHWINYSAAPKVDYSNSIEEALRYLFALDLKNKNEYVLAG